MPSKIHKMAFERLYINEVTYSCLLALFFCLFIVRLCFVLMRNEIKRTSSFNGNSGLASFKYFSSPTSFRT